MLFNPIHHLSSMIIKFVVRRVNLPHIFLSLAPAFFSVARSLIRTEGFLPTIQTLNAINREIMRRGPLSDISANRRLNPVVVRALTNVLFGSWGDIIDNSKIINSKYKWYVLGLILSKFNTIIFYFIRIFIGLILSSIGILFSDTLSSIPYLKGYALSILNFIQDHSFFNFFSNTKEVISKEQLEKSYSYSFLGIIVLGLVGITAGLLVGDFYFHDYISNIIMRYFNN
jgi:hypothetical protein